MFHAGYWAPTVGFYGGVNYGFGYTGEGYHGGYWRNRQFVYNRAVDNLGAAHVASYANQAFAPANHISFNGGRGGTTAQATSAELAAAGAPHTPLTAVQIEHQQSASRISTQRYSENKGSPPIMAVARANDFRGANTTLPIAHSVAGARPNGPFVRSPPTGAKATRQVPNGPTAPTGAVPNFAPQAVTTHPPAPERNMAARSRPVATHGTQMGGGISSGGLSGHRVP